MLATTNARPPDRLTEPGTVLVVKSNVGRWRPDRLLPRASTGLASRTGRELHARAHPCLGRSLARVAKRGCAPTRGSPCGLGGGAWCEVASDEGMQAVGRVVGHLVQADVAWAGPLSCTSTAPTTLPVGS